MKTQLIKKLEEIKNMKVWKQDLKEFNGECNELELNQPELFNKVWSFWRKNQ